MGEIGITSDLMTPVVPKYHPCTHPVYHQLVQEPKCQRQCEDVDSGQAFFTLGDHAQHTTA